MIRDINDEEQVIIPLTLDILKQKEKHPRKRKRCTICQSSEHTKRKCPQNINDNAIEINDNDSNHSTSRISLDYNIQSFVNNEILADQVNKLFHTTSNIDQVNNYISNEHDNIHVIPSKLITNHSNVTNQSCINSLSVFEFENNANILNLGEELMNNKSVHKNTTTTTTNNNNDDNTTTTTNNNDKTTTATTDNNNNNKNKSNNNNNDINNSNNNNRIQNQLDSDSNAKKNNNNNNNHHIYCNNDNNNNNNKNDTDNFEEQDNYDTHDETENLISSSTSLLSHVYILLISDKNLKNKSNQLLVNGHIDILKINAQLLLSYMKMNLKSYNLKAVGLNGMKINVIVNDHHENQSNFYLRQHLILNNKPTLVSFKVSHSMDKINSIIQEIITKFHKKYLIDPKIKRFEFDFSLNPMLVSIGELFTEDDN